MNSSLFVENKINMKKIIFAIVLNTTLFGFSQNNSLYYNGTSQFYSVADSPELDLSSNFTIECWVAVEDYSSYFAILSKGWCNGANTSFHLSINDGKVRFAWNPNGDCTSSTSYMDTDGVFFYPKGESFAKQCHHVAVVHSGTTIKILIDGQEVPTTIYGSVTTLNNSSEDLLIGIYKSFSGAYVNSLVGEIDELRIWNKVRTQAEIDFDYQHSLTGNESELILYYNFDNISTGDDILNTSNNAVYSHVAIPSTSFPNVISACELLSSVNVEEIVETVNLNLFPNPGNNLNITISNDIIETIVISNIIGETVYSNLNVGVNSYEINKSELAEGNYIVKVKTRSGKEITEKWIKAN